MSFIDVRNDRCSVVSESLLQEQKYEIFYSICGREQIKTSDDEMSNVRTVRIERSV